MHQLAMCDALFEKLDRLSPVSIDHWRHGTKDTYVFEHDGAHWRVTIDVHHSEGWQTSDGMEAVRVVPREKTVTEWVTDKSP